MNQANEIRRLGRTTGLLYLVVIVFGMFSPIVLETLVVPGDAATTASNIVGSLWLFRVSLVGWILIVVTDVILSVVLYLLLEPIGRALSLISAAFRGVYSTILGAYLIRLYNGFLLLTEPERGGAFETPEIQTLALADFETFGAGFTLALVFFGVHMILFGILLKRSKYVPTVLAVLLAVAGTGYVLNGLAPLFITPYSDLMSTVLLTPAILGEFGLTGWLLVKGVRVADDKELAHAT